jgi:hypothetical protein
MKEETLKILSEHNKTPKDVVWCGSVEFGWFSFDDFMEIAPVDYYSGFGGQEIAKDLLIVGEDFWLERHEYDGSEWWEYKELPKKPENYNKPKTIMNGESWATLVEMNRDGGKYQSNA